MAKKDRAFEADGECESPWNLNMLQRAWVRTNDAEREAFLEWIGKSPLRPDREVPDVLTGADGYLLPEVIEMIQIIRERRGLIGYLRSETAPIMVELGYAACDPRLGSALVGNCRLKEDFLVKLRDWLRTAWKHDACLGG